MAWPQAPQPAPAPPAAAGSSLDIGALVAGGAGVLTFFFSFVQIMKVDFQGIDSGASVWTTDPGFFGIGTWIPLFALVAGAAALARAFVPGLGDKVVAGFGVAQVQMAAFAFAFLLWLGYMVNIVLSENVTFGLGAFLLFLGLAGVGAGTVLSILSEKKGTSAPAAPGQWPAPTPPPAPGYPQPDQGQWPPQQAPAPVDPNAWNQPPPAAPQWQPPAPPQAAAPGQWQPDPAGQPAPVDPSWPAPGTDQQWSGAPAGGGPDPYQPQPQPPVPAPEPGPLDPQPAPPVDPGGPSGGGLFDPGTQVIPGPPPAPPVEDPDAGPGLPPLPPSNTP